MGTYYINANTNYTDSRYPYGNGEAQGYRYGAKSFTQLFSDPLFVPQDGDTILVYCPVGDPEDSTSLALYSVNESARTSPIIITTSLTIATFNPTASIMASIECPNTAGVGMFKFLNYAENSKLSNLIFTKLNMKPGKTIEIVKCLGITINSCVFTYTNAWASPVDFSNWLYFDGCFGTMVDSCSFRVPANDLGANQNVTGNALLMIDCYGADIKNNVFNASAGVCKCIVNITCSNVRIYGNVLYDFKNPNGTVLLPGIAFRAMDITNVDTIDIYNNVVHGVINGYCGIFVNNASITNMNQYIRNNVVVVEDGNTIGIAVHGSSSSYVFVYNNTVTAVAETIYAKAMDLVIASDHGFVDYNDLFNIQPVNEFVWNGDPSTISTMGSHTQRIDPNLGFQNGGDISKWSSYTNSSKSLLIGMGSEYTDIGLFTTPNFYAVVDSVLAGTVGSAIPVNAGTTSYGTYMNNTLDMASGIADSGGFANNPTDAFYENQFGWNNQLVVFPFTSKSDLFKQNDKYVITHRDELYPFANIKCPANPGRGKADKYPEYETGLFGYPRIVWQNGCVVTDPCVIQDTIDNTKSWQTVLESDVSGMIMQNSITNCSDQEI